MQIVIAGSTGFIGNHLVNFLSDKGHRCVGIGRHDFQKGISHLSSLISGSDVLVNLVGASIDGRWTKVYKQKLLESRVDTTKMLIAALSQLNQKPELFVSASASGIYDSVQIHDENSVAYADDFLGQLCQRWEKEALVAGEQIRTVIIRTAIVLGADGGMFKKMKSIFKWGGAAKMGDGSQAFPWIHIEDYLRAVECIIETSTIHGPVNLVAPGISTNRVFSMTLAKALHRPVLLSIPAFLLNVLLGEQADIILKGQRMIPKVLLENGFVFQYPELSSVLKSLLMTSSEQS
ncbi:MAG: TIGR01777 family oxidoreductase [Bacteroidales bacterium]|nr:TIGR01777 family oxidoreductase [Bacteroidales bacterium]